MNNSNFKAQKVGKLLALENGSKKALGEKITFRLTADTKKFVNICKNHKYASEKNI